MKQALNWALILTMLVGLVACTPQVSEELFPISGEALTASVGTLQSEKPREMAPKVDESDLEALVEGNNAFAFDLYQALIREEDSNLLYSPYSISLALAMTYAGARGDTERQMRNTLHFDLPQMQLHPAFNSLEQELSRRGEGAMGKDGKKFRLRIAKAIWGQKDFAFLVDFLNVLSENYGAGLRILDFASAPEKSRSTINDWVSNETEGRIKDLIPPDAITPKTRLLLTNAIYFNAAWRSPFKKESTRDMSFYLLNGGNVLVPMMRQTEYFKYTEGKSYQVVELPYDGDEVSMVVLLPKEGEFAAFEKSLDSRRLKTIISNLGRREVTLSMPKFEFRSEFDLKNLFSVMGMSDAFGEQADFSGMTGKRGVWIDRILHQSFISTDEDGTEAAAATAVVMAGSAPGQPKPVVMTIDRPFVFIIRDIQTNTILFIGRVLNPSA